MVQVNGGTTPLPVPNGQLPCEGTKAYPFLLDFTAANAYAIDFTQQYQQKQFRSLQTVYVDNSLNTSAFQIICQSGTQQTITVPAGAQGYFPILAPEPPKFIVQTSGALVLEVIFLNFYVPPGLWNNTPLSAGGLPQVDVPALDAVITGNAVNVTAVPGTAAAITDASGTIAVGGTAQQILAANATRKRFILTNPITATETLSFMFNNGAAGKIDLAPGMIWDENGLEVAGAALWAVAATTAHAFTLYWY